MPLSKPIFQLKRTAKSLSRVEKIPLNQALDRVAAEEGFRAWSELASSPLSLSSTAHIFNELEHGDFLLLGGRPRQGKTAMALKLVVEAMKRGNQGVFFTLDYNPQGVVELFAKIGVNPRKYDGLFKLDNADNIDAQYIMQQMESAPRGTLIVVDYLQLLDQRRKSPILATQLEALKLFACENGLIMIFSSQIDRNYELSEKLFPDMRDVRLPNPLDLSIFDKAGFMNGGEIRMQGAVA